MRRLTRTVRPWRPWPAAFTLVELVVVIGLVVVLAALVLGVGMAVMEGSETRQTNLVLTLLDAAVGEFEATGERQVSFGVDGQPGGNEVYELQHPPTVEDADLVTLTREYVAVLARPAAVREMLAQIDDDFVERIQGAGDQMVIKDAWDAPVIAVLAGREWARGFDDPALRDEDGTLRTEIELRFGPARDRRTYFISAGPDGKFGSTDAAAPQAERDLARDNLYSYAPAPPPQP